VEPDSQPSDPQQDQQEQEKPNTPRAIQVQHWNHKQQHDADRHLAQTLQGYEVGCNKPEVTRNHLCVHKPVYSMNLSGNQGQVSPHRC
jgi:hypothetical protein